ncbi:Zinc/cadmium resistance protein [Diplogelasinospora grovesii]|uniref:Zinc/cadmium resistance protein n=1 Tax=Diplogelasinospora grovesii TaxID=303347 RepID=A0AAN6S9H7_9PEZI|nr:Zinc/cadmium resistance protein [Diplogelasinospora grovesii]
MGWSKSTRIKVMLAIDVMFFLLELTVGLAVGSLALMADAFHMLNDIISLLVGLWAVVVAQKATTDKYSYGWLRAEILGAFFNAVFLIALCVSIVLDAVNRFIDPPEISNPQLILIVGCLGLASNLVGFLVLGGHGHSHGPGEYSHDEDRHSHADELHNAEQGRAGILDSEQSVADENGRVADILPEAAVARYNTASPEVGRHIRFDHADGARSGSRISAQSRGRDRRRGSCRLTSIDDISIHPASFRQEIIAASRPQPDDETSSESSIDENAVLDETEPREDTPLLKKDSDGKGPNGAFGRSRSPSRRPRRDSAIHIQHHHNKPKKSTGKSGHGHSHGDMGMNAMILHVIGDALGNVGVIVTALVIWLTDWPGRFYADPTVSLFITLIILRSTIPLTVATAKILLQATPESIDLNDVREDIQALPGVISCHHVHIWQLSDTNIVASMHIKLAFPISEANGARYMEVAKQARKCLHAYGIHSATIQPEFCLDASHDHGEDAALQVDGSVVPKPACGSEEGSLCLLECVDNCVGKGCCSGMEPRPGSSNSAHDHDHDHGHSHDHA